MRSHIQVENLKVGFNLTDVEDIFIEEIYDVICVFPRTESLGYFPLMVLIEGCNQCIWR